MPTATIDARVCHGTRTEPCVVTETPWPYECRAQDKHPDHQVLTCQTHHVWTHRPRPTA